MCSQYVSKSWSEKVKGVFRNLSYFNVLEAEDFKKRWQEYTEELYKKDLLDPDNHSGVITHLDRARHPGI